MKLILNLIFLSSLLSSKYDFILLKTTYVKTNASYNSEAKQLLSETGIDSFICAADTVCLFGKKAVRMSNSLVSRITNTAVTKSVPTQCEVQIDSTTSSGNDIQKTASILPVG